MVKAYVTYPITSSWYQWMIIVTSFFLAGLAFLYYHYIFMPDLSYLWTWYGAPIMIVPVWIIYGTHELAFYLYTKYHGISYYYTISVPYLLFVVICIVYGSLSLTLYRLFGFDARLIVPTIFLPALAVRVAGYRQASEAEAHLLALLSSFIVTMVFVLWIESLGGVDVVFSRILTERRAFIPHGAYGIALYGLLVCLTESIPLKVDGFAFDGYELFKSGNLGMIVTDTIIMFVTFYVLVFCGYLEWFMNPLT